MQPALRERPASAGAASRRLRTSSIHVAALLAAAPGCGRRAAEAPPPPSTSPPAAPADFAKLTGKWLRPDGGYVLDIRAAAPDGHLTALYFNPNLINVSAARAAREGGALKVFVELRDTGYPGCTYTLTYDATADQLWGDYFQAAMQEHYDIVFLRQP